MEIIDMINAKLRAAGMSGAELARRIGVSTGVYSQWKNNNMIGREKEGLGYYQTLPFFIFSSSQPEAHILQRTD